MLSFMDSKKSIANTSTTVAVDSYNRAFNSVRNTSDSNNLNIAVGASADPFTNSGDAVDSLIFHPLAFLGVWTTEQGSR